MVNTTEPHRRYNPLTRSWILVSPHRTQRPWQGAQESGAVDARPSYDPKCYLCPGNSRAGGEVNEKYTETFVFTNDFAAVKPPSAESEAALKEAKQEQQDELFRAEPVTGTCQVICFSPQHDKTLAQLPVAGIQTVIKTWQKVLRTAQAHADVTYCQIFENKGSAMGCSNPHPHGQAWMTSIVPEEPAHEALSLADYQRKHAKGLLEDYVEKELSAAGTPRVVVQRDTFVAVVPYWATWPFEILVVSRRRVPSLLALTADEEADLAAVLKEITVRYDNLFLTSFPYSMGIHQALPGAPEEDVAHLHFHFYPPLLRSATVKKFLVGFEMLGMAQRDLTAEKAAEMLRAVDGQVHYLEKKE